MTEVTPGLGNRLLGFFGVDLQGGIIQTVRTQLERPVVRASTWSFLGFGTAQVFRFANNLILTRLLFPEAFGLMALVSTIITGLALFSDTGARAFIIQNPRGENPEYIHTAWTVAIFRGFALMVAAILLAWPFSRIFGEPQLAQLTAVAALGAFIAGFGSIAPFIAQRNLRLGKVTALNVIGQIAGLLVTIILASIWRSVWSLVIGGVIGILISTLLSHVIFRALPMRFSLNRTVAGEMFRFGRWIFLSTVLTFFLKYLDRLFLGKFMTMDQFGVYMVALMLATLVPSTMNAVGGQVLLPAFKNYMQMDDALKRAKVFKIRIAMLAIALPPLYLLTVFGPQLVAFLYDARYGEAGWMLQVLAVGASYQVITSTTGPVFLASGESFQHMIYVAIGVIVVTACLTFGGYFFGGTGVVFGSALSMVLLHVPRMVMIRRYGVLMPRLEVFLAVTTAAVASIGLFVALSGR